MDKAKEIVILSGKGGTGKTTVTLGLVKKFKNKVTADADVDAADMFIIMEPKIKKHSEFTGMSMAKINYDKCINCGLCGKLCRFDAIGEAGEKPVIDETACDGCGLCTIACPQKAITMEPQVVGEWFLSQSDEGDFVHAKLYPGAENSGNLVAMVKQQAKIMADEKGKKYILIDGPPGIGCPVISAVSGADMVLFVVDPSLSAMYDLKRIDKLIKHFGVKSAVVINKCGINDEITKKIEEYCAENNLSIIGKIGFDKCVSAALNKKQFPYHECASFAGVMDGIYSGVLEAMGDA